jgi:hypothetical protein
MLSIFICLVGKSLFVEILGLVLGPNSVEVASFSVTGHFSIKAIENFDRRLNQRVI